MAGYVTKLMLNAVTDTANGAALDAARMIAVSAMVISTGTITGSVKLQASNDIPPAEGNPSQFVPTNWVDISGASVTLTAGTVQLIPKTETCYRWVRAVATKTGGTGTITVIPSALKV